MDAEGALLEATDLARAFPEGIERRQVLRSFSVALHPGRIVALVGPNAVGKSTVLKLLGGIDQPDGGTVVARPGTSVAIQLQEVEETLLPWLTNAANATFGLEARGVDGAEAGERVRRLMRDFDVVVPLDKRTATSSGGERQLVSFLRTVVTDPDVLLLDEPFSRVDPARIRGWWRFLRRYVSERGSACLLVTHDVVEAATLADLVLVMGLDDPDRGSTVVASVEARGPDGAGIEPERAAPELASRITRALDRAYA